VIGFLSGTLVSRGVTKILVNSAGLGFEVQVPISTLEKLPDAGAEVQLHTHLGVRDDGFALYGFHAERERDLFRLLIRVSGIGPRLGLAALSGMTADELVHCLRTEDKSRLTTLPGIGGRTAARLVLEMRDKLADWEVADGGTAAAPPRDAQRALEALGYSAREAARALSAVQGEVAADDIEGLVRRALRHQSGTS